MGDSEKKVPGSPLFPESWDQDGGIEFTDLLARYGGDSASGKKAGAAAEQYFAQLQEGFRPLLGEDGFRALVQEAHRRTVEGYPVLEKCIVEGDGRPFFVGLGESLSGEDPDAVWSGLQALTDEFLQMVNRVGRREEIMAAVRRNVLKANPEGDIENEEKGRTRSDAGQEETSHTRSSDPWKILVMDRDRMTCEAMIQALDKAPDFHVVGYGLNPDEVREVLEREEPDFVVASSHLPSEDVLDVCRWLRKEHTGEFPHIVVTGLPHDEAVILKFLEAGGAAFTMEDFSVEGLRLTLRLLARGESVFPLRLQHLMSMRLSELAELVRDRGLNPDTLSELTAREGEVLLLLEEGLTNREVAKRLYISEGTVKSHVHQILRKLNVRNRKEAVRVLRLQRASPGKLVLGKSGFRKEKRPLERES